MKYIQLVEKDNKGRIKKNEEYGIEELYELLVLNGLYTGTYTWFKKRLHTNFTRIIRRLIEFDK